MLKNIFIYLAVLASTFAFSIFYYDWFSWYLLILVLCVPILSLVVSLPFMIYVSVKGVEVSTTNELTTDDKLCVKISSGSGKKLFCPFVKIRFRLANRFAQKKKTVNFLYSGFFDAPVFLETDSVTHNCGCLEISAKYYKIYDLLGMFFIRAKLEYHDEVLINPRSVEVNVPSDIAQNKIITYRKKPNGYAEEYELRDYKKGDNLKNIHWKISAKYNKLTVKEPIIPVYRQVVLCPMITSNPQKNNVTLGKLMYTSCVLCDNNTEFFCALPNGEVCKINNINDVKSYLLQLYKNGYVQGRLELFDNPVVYKIACDKEAVTCSE